MGIKLQTHCKRGHEFTKENTYLPPNNSGRHCVTCRKERHLANPQKYDPIKMRGYRAKWRERNPDYHKNHWLQRVYKISLDEFREMVTLRENKCDICKEQMVEPHVDHDHACCPSTYKTCGKCVRGLLCAKCNFMLGAINDSEEALMLAINYLRKSKEAKLCQV